MDVSPLDADLLNAVVRLVRLLDSQHLFRVLSPLVTREIVYESVCFCGEALEVFVPLRYAPCGPQKFCHCIIPPHH